MPPKKHNTNRNIRDFFKPYTIPRNRIPLDDESEDEITVAPSGKEQGKTENSAIEPVKPPSGNNAGTNRIVSRQSLASISPLERDPTKARPRNRSNASQANSNADDDLFHSSPSSAAQHKMSSVAIPSPSPTKRSPSPIFAPRLSAPATQPTRSFSSFSTLSSIPQSSGSSRRVMRDGLQAVANSDSDSDSIDELADLDSFFPRKKMKMTPPPGKDAANAIQLSSGKKPDMRNSGGRSLEQGSRKSRPTRPPAPPKPTYKFSLAKMAAESRKRQEADARIAEAEATVQAAEKLRESEATPADSLAHLDAAKLTEMFNAEEDENQRTILALARTEALDRQETFEYFKDKPRRAKDTPLRSRILPKASWAEGLDDVQTMEQACLSGFMADLASYNMLNKDVITWLAQQLIHEPREDLCEAYVEIIRAATEHADQVDGRVLSTLQTFYWTTIATDDHVATKEPHQNNDDLPMSSQLSVAPKDVVFCVCGIDEERGRTVACDDCDTWQHTTCYYPQYDGKTLPGDFKHLCIDCKPRPIDQAVARNRQSRTETAFESEAAIAAGTPDKAPGLPCVARVLRYCAPLAGPEALGQAICDLALANNDDFVRNKSALRQAVCDAIEGLCDTIKPEETDEICKYAVKTLLTDEKLSLNMQARLTASLPATSTKTHIFRRRLALYLMTRSQKVRALTSPEWVGMILKRLNTAPEFAMGDKSDYEIILNLTSVLDIAIDAGFSDFAFLENATREPVKTGPFGKAPAVISAEEKDFNRHIDMLADQVKHLASRITGAGASHIKRVEAKSALERMCLRLEYGVRTRPKPRKGVFGELSQEKEGRKSMEAYVKSWPQDESFADINAQKTKRSLELPERPSPRKKRVSIADSQATPKAISDVDDSFHTAVEERDEKDAICDETLSDHEMSDHNDDGGFTAEGADESAAGEDVDNEAEETTPPSTVRRSSWDFGASCVRF